MARAAHHVVFHASREGRASEITIWANAATALGVAISVGVAAWSELALPPTRAVWVGLVGFAFAFVGLRVALAHRSTLWIAAGFGTLTVAAVGGSLAWLFGHLLDGPSAPSIAAVLGAVVAALGPAWGYARLARRRAEGVRDSLIEPVSASRGG